MTEYVPQVGGAHYEYGELLNQHWDLMDRWDIEYLPGCGTKYVLRWDRKGTPHLDIPKGISYFRKILSRQHNQGLRRTVPAAAMAEWFVSNGLRLTVPREAEKRLILELVLVDGTTYALNTAIQHMISISSREGFN